MFLGLSKRGEVLTGQTIKVILYLALIALAVFSVYRIFKGG